MKMSDQRIVALSLHRSKPKGEGTQLDFWRRVVDVIANDLNETNINGANNFKSFAEHGVKRS